MKSANYRQFSVKLPPILAFFVFLIILASFLMLPDIQAKRIEDFLLVYPGTDKVIHFGKHILIVTLGYFFLGNTPIKVFPKSRLFLAIGFSISFSIVDESHQIFIPGRSFECKDLLVNLFGTLTGILILLRKKVSQPIWLTAVTILIIPAGIIAYDF